MKSVFAKSTVALCLGLLIGLAFQVTFTKFTEPALATVSLNPVTLEVLGNPFAQTPLSTTLKAEAISFALPRTVIGSVQQNGNQIVMMPMLIDLNSDGLEDLAYSMPSGGSGWQQFVALASGENTFQVVYSCTASGGSPISYRGHCAG